MLLAAARGWAAPAFTLNGQPAGATPACALTLCDGLSGRPIEGRMTSETNWQAHDGHLACAVAAVRQGRATVYRLTVSTAAHDRQHLVRAAIALAGTGARFWDGLEERVWDGTTPLERDSLDYTFPLACAYDADQGLAVGMPPDVIVSTLHCAARGGKLLYETRLVVDAAHPQAISFVAYRFEPTFGYRDAVQDYYELFPAAFRPSEGLDPRIYGVGGYHLSSHRSRRLQINSIRRAHTDWEWSYAPWVISGNWYPEKEDWVEGRDVIRGYEDPHDQTKGTWEQYHEARTRQFQEGDKTSAMFYYVLVKDINRQLVNQFPDSRLVTRGEFLGGRPLAGGNLGALAGEDALLTSAYGTGLAARLEEEVRKVAANYEISGFAFDMANRALDDYGPGQQKCGVGRTFDDEGRVYSPDTISACLIADHIHTLRRADKRMGVIMNQAMSRSVCFPVFHADGVMFEGLPNRLPQNVMPLRLMSGKKPFTFWNNIEGGRNNRGIRWELAADPQVAKEIRSGLALHTLLSCLRIGATPMNWAVADVGREWMPTLIELKRLGWNPAPAVLSSSPDLWIGRFGQREDTIITVSNPKRHCVRSELTVLNRYFGGKAYRFTSDQGQPLEQRATCEQTAFAVDLAPKEIMVLRTRAAPPKPSMIVNPQEVLEFFTEADALAHRADFAIVVPEKASRAERIAAEMIESYYANYQAYKERPNDLEPGFMNKKWDAALRTAIFAASKLPPAIRKHIALERADAPIVHVVQRNGRSVLVIGGKDEPEIERASRAYLELLDAKYIRRRP
jgi:hypothetical protein